MWIFPLNIYSTNNTFHADVHPEFSILKREKLVQIDFGCVKVFPGIY